MGFKIGSELSPYWWPVVVRTAADGGKFDETKFEVKFKRLPRSRTMEIGEAIEAGKIDDATLTTEVVLDWKGLDVEFSAEALVKALEVQGFAIGVLMAWRESLIGARRKN